MSQTHIFNFFPSSVHSGRILKTLSLFASRERNIYVPTNQIWPNRLYFQISNSPENICLTVDTRGVNDFGPAKFRTRADNGQEQHCYFNRSYTDSRYKCFLAKRVGAAEQQDRPVFSIVEQNYFLAEPYKSDTDSSITITATDGKTTSKKQHQQTSAMGENSYDGLPRTRDRPLDARESTSARKRIQLFGGRDDGDRRQE